MKTRKSTKQTFYDTELPYVSEQIQGSEFLMTGYRKLLQGSLMEVCGTHELYAVTVAKISSDIRTSLAIYPCKAEKVLRGNGTQEFWGIILATQSYCMRTVIIFKYYSSRNYINDYK